MKPLLTILTLCVIGMHAGDAACAQANERQDPALIHQAIDNFLRAQTAGLPGKASYTIGSIDPRVALASCPAPEISLPSGARLWGATAVGVRCSAPAPWSIHVNVLVRIAGDYMVTARPLPQGHVMMPTDLVSRSGDLTQLPAGIVTDSQFVLGKTLTASLAAGHPLRTDLLRSPIVVQQGQTVKLQSTGPGFQISADAKSLNNAADGQIAQVRTANGQTVSGVARAGGIVEIKN